MESFRAVYKILLFAVSAVAYLTSAFVAQLFIRDEAKRRRFFTHNVLVFARWGLWFMNIKVIAKNVPPEEAHHLMICNHMGMLDVVVLASIRPSLFITSVEMQRTPGLGLLCEMGGCLFVERRTRAGIPGEIQRIREALKQGLNVTLYPEGTSTNGEKILPFKKSLMTAAAGSGAPLLPIVLNYTHVNGEPMSDKWRDSVCWYGDISFEAAIWKMFAAREIVAEIEFLDEIHIHSEDQRREIAAIAQARIEAGFRPILKPASEPV